MSPDAAVVHHLAYYGYEKTVIDSQVVTPAVRLASDSVAVRLLFLEDPLPWALRRWVPKAVALENIGLIARFLPRAPRNVLHLNSLQVARFLGPALRGGAPVVVHARGFQAAHALLPIKRRHPNLRVICDARGIEAEEFELDIRSRHGELTPSQMAWKIRLSEIEREAVAGSDAVFCVSRSMIPFLKRRAGPAASAKPFEYVPCCVEPDHFAEAIGQREAVRRELGIGDRLALVYSGSLSAWQVPEKMLKVAMRFLELHPESVFLGLTPEPARLKAAAMRAGVPASRLRSLKVSHDHVRFYLAASDAALLLREDNDVNRYACPTKFAEYLATGLHVIATPAVEEVAATLRETGAGTLIESLDAGADDALRAAGAAARDVDARVKKSLAAARDRYDWSRHLPTVKKWYLDLLSSPRSE
ncbi:MAG: hypothetical protein JO102_04490 [Elusimicrobia bacterium]|nr:hypothetical protein [Elusimicrobiota bacterium]